MRSFSKINKIDGWCIWKFIFQKLAHNCPICTIDTAAQTCIRDTLVEVCRSWLLYGARKLHLDQCRWRTFASKATTKTHIGGRSVSIVGKLIVVVILVGLVGFQLHTESCKYETWNGDDFPWNSCTECVLDKALLKLLFRTDNAPKCMGERANAKLRVNISKTIWLYAVWAWKPADCQLVSQNSTFLVHQCWGTENSK